MQWNLYNREHIRSITTKLTRSGQLPPAGNNNTTLLNTSLTKHIEY